MKRYGKINFLGDLEVVTNLIQNNNTIVINPTHEDYISNGYKLIVYGEALPDKEGFNLEKYYEETGDTIYIKYRYVENTPADIPEGLEVMDTL